MNIAETTLFSQDAITRFNLATYNAYSQRPIYNKIISKASLSGDTMFYRTIDLSNYLNPDNVSKIFIWGPNGLLYSLDLTSYKNNKILCIPTELLQDEIILYFTLKASEIVEASDPRIMPNPFVLNLKGSQLIKSTPEEAVNYDYYKYIIKFDTDLNTITSITTPPLHEREIELNLQYEIVTSGEVTFFIGSDWADLASFDITINFRKDEKSI